MTDPIAVPRPAGAKSWADGWLADAAMRRGLPGVARLAEYAHLPSAWHALLAAGVAPDAVLELACLVSATKAADLATAGPADAGLLKQADAERLRVVAVGTDGQTLTIASSNPLSSTIERELAAATRRRIDIVTASPMAIDAALACIYPVAQVRVAAELRAPASAQRRSPHASQPANATEPAEVPEVVRARIAGMIETIFAEALREEASDVHFEPKEEGLLVRYRVDGALYDAHRVPPELSSQVIRRLKVLAQVDIADTLRPQDGRMSITHDARNIDMRVSTLPLGGSLEKVVVRILDSRVAERNLDAIGYSERELARVKRLLDMPEGLILVTGPTGSGKTSTLYAAMRHVHRADLNVVTVEDPIEYRIAGINQVQVNEKARMTFAASLRSILRQDPDVVLIGEMRDAETASIAVKASMTGHLVLSTLHASDAISTLDRLYGMEIDTGALAGSLKGIVGQRLVRKLCQHCAQLVALSDLPLHQQQLLAGRQTAELRRPVGCASCRGTGYHGRTLVAEIFIVTTALQRAIARRADLGELGDLARDGGTISMWESGLERVLAGVTSLHELLDNVAAPVLAEDAGDTQADVDALLARLLGGNAPVAAPADAGLRLSTPAAVEIVRAAVDEEPGLPGTPLRGIRPGARRHPGPSLRVLLVDDAHAERRQLAEALGAEGITVIEAADGDAALAYAERLRPDVIITEVALPKLDAFGLLQALRLAGNAVPLVVHTRQGDGELVAWLREAGVEDVLSRSTDARTLAARLRAMVAGAGETAA